MTLLALGSLVVLLLGGPALAAEVVKMGDLPAISNAGLYVAIEKGYFGEKGIAVETEKGLLVPVIRRANELSVLGLARAMDDLAAAMSCEKGDFAEYAQLRRSLTEREGDLSRARASSRRAEAARSLAQLRPGDIIRVPGGRRAGLGRRGPALRETSRDDVSIDPAPSPPPTSSEAYSTRSREQTWATKREEIQ